MDLYCEIITKIQRPQELYQFINNKKIDFYSINPNTLINIAEILAINKENTQYQTLASRALSIALSGKIEEGQIIKATLSLKKIAEPEEVVKFVSAAIVKYPNLAQNATLLAKQATAKMDMAKKCIDTGKDYKSNPKTKARAWEMCRQLLDEAERELNLALDNVDNSAEKSFIENDMKFLNSMKKISQKPPYR